jgi:hypothetical protein
MRPANVLDTLLPASTPAPAPTPTLTNSAVQYTVTTTQSLTVVGVRSHILSRVAEAGDQSLAVVSGSVFQFDGLEWQLHLKLAKEKSDEKEPSLYGFLNLKTPIQTPVKVWWEMRVGPNTGYTMEKQFEKSFSWGKALWNAEELKAVQEAPFSGVNRSLHAIGAPTSSSSRSPSSLFMRSFGLFQPTHTENDTLRVTVNMKREKYLEALSHLSGALGSALHDTKHSDVVLRCGDGVEIPAHKVRYFVR